MNNAASKRVFYDRQSGTNISQELARACCFIPRSLQHTETHRVRCIATPVLYHYSTAVAISTIAIILKLKLQLYIIIILNDIKFQQYLHNNNIPWFSTSIKEGWSCQVRLRSHKSNTHLLAHIPGTCTLIFSSCGIFTVYHNSIVMASHPSPGDNPPERRRAVRKNAGPCNNACVKLTHLHMHQGSPFLPIFRALPRSLHRHTYPQGYLYAIHLTLPRSTPYPSSTHIRHHHPSSHTVLIHSLHHTVLKYSTIRMSTIRYSSNGTPPFQYSLIRSTSSPTHLLIPYIVRNEEVRRRAGIEMEQPD